MVNESVGSKRHLSRPFLRLRLSSPPPLGCPPPRHPAHRTESCRARSASRTASPLPATTTSVVHCADAHAPPESASHASLVTLRYRSRDFYAGVLPLIRCPICLVPMRVDRWTRPLGTKSATVEKICELRKQYEALCMKACALTPPCCHKANYTHLSRKDLSFKEMSQPLALLPSKVVEFRKLVAGFCGHRVDARDAINYATEFRR